MELAYYADYAVRLVNTEAPLRGTDALTSVEAVRELFGSGAQATKAVDADVPRLRAVRTRLRGVFEAADEGDEVRAVDLLNQLMLEFPVSPQISGHNFLNEDTGRPDWHMHLAEQAANAGAGYSASACMGLAVQLTTLGVDRLGICQAMPCRNAYVDTSTNRSRRYCSDRCATRANVAAYRARKRLENERSARSGLTQDAAQLAHEPAPATER
ncbi:Putative stress-induced transcription regulator [Streptomyces sp. DvalAA-14]|uniref:CGNR zinc finger domain-containing protein n=1 Tax=unclassified Streptomyces TaxID=2593676 RepID=UPI00081B078C|nr:CGNR zinc finger domain-containing protein [Streptomyces sp. DvalAA-14]MYS23864.1 zf-CGNR multi-domain protein [Streptomyces sp. SID4948]SCE39641.1 Putative stress-induced transcription regulator [Streptomyces sp. DvalAA-14]